MSEGLVLVRLSGEVSTKSARVRRRFTQRLVDNMRAALDAAGQRARLQNEWSRILLQVPDTAAACEVLRRVFGVASVSPVDCTCAPDLAEIVRVGHERYQELIRGKTYAVRARRAGKHSFSAQDVNVQLGAALNPYGTVNLDNPQVTVHVEVRHQKAYLFTRVLPGYGGLPVGVEGKAVCLISGGFDSAVAAWLMLKRGVELDYVLCNLGGAAYERQVLAVVKLLAEAWSYGSQPRLSVVDFEPVVPLLREKVKPAYLQVVLKRLMYRIGCRVAELVGGLAVVTGESVGQVSSQTLANLRAIDAVANFPVLRPVIGYNKEEITRLAQEIGTYALSAVVQEHCALVPKHPVTAATPHAADLAEEPLDLSILEDLFRVRRTIDVLSVDEAELAVSYVFVDRVPHGAVVIDCRPEELYEEWHYPGAEHRDVDELLLNYKQLPRENEYVLYCTWGLQSAALAEQMQRAGYRAYSFRGGVRALKRYVDAQRSIGEHDLGAESAQRV